MPRVAARVLFRGSTVVVIDSRCRGEVAAASKAPEMLAAPEVHQLLLTRAGMFVQHMGGNRGHQVIVDPGTALLFNAGDVYRTTHPQGGGDDFHDCTLFQFAPDEAAAVMASFDPSAVDRPAAPFSRRHGPLSPALALRNQALRARLRRGEPDTMALDEEALGILEAAVVSAHQLGVPHKGPNTRTWRRHRELAAGVRERLAGAPTNPHSLATLAHDAGCSAYHLARVFQQHQGVPVHQYLVRLRLSLALQHLADGVPDLATLAVKLGFSSHSHFAALFRRTFGVPPSAARQILGVRAPRSRWPVPRRARR